MDLKWRTRCNPKFDNTRTPWLPKNNPSKARHGAEDAHMFYDQAATVLVGVFLRRV